MTVLYPSIDVRAGQVVRLTQGDYGRETVYGDDPAAVARSFAEAGASWIHMVDLDAARAGADGVAEADNRPAIERAIAAARAVRPEVRVQVGGGVRTVEAAGALRDAGVSRVVMGSAAVADPGLVEAVADVVDVAVGLDHRDGVLAVHGWTDSSDLRLFDVLDRFPRAAAFVITNIARDGMLTGPDRYGLAEAVAATAVPVIASGGVGSLNDVRELADIDGLHGVIVGRAIYEGRLTVSEALAVLAASP